MRRLNVFFKKKRELHHYSFFQGTICFINCASAKWGTRTQIIFTAAKLMAIALLIITGLVRLAQGNSTCFVGVTYNVEAQYYISYLILQYCKTELIAANHTEKWKCK